MWLECVHCKVRNAAIDSMLQEIGFPMHVGL
jgi:hypothetical protein